MEINHTTTLTSNQLLKAPFVLFDRSSGIEGFSKQNFWKFHFLHWNSKAAGFQRGGRRCEGTRGAEWETSRRTPSLRRLAERPSKTTIEFCRLIVLANKVFKAAFIISEAHLWNPLPVWRPPLPFDLGGLQEKGIKSCGIVIDEELLCYLLGHAHHRIVYLDVHMLRTSLTSDSLSAETPMSVLFPPRDISSLFIPNAVVTRSSLLGNPHYVLSCWTFVLSHRSGGHSSKGILVVWHLDSCSLHAWSATFCLKRLGLIESFRRFLVVKVVAIGI
jgi:hypothetical protein